MLVSHYMWPIAMKRITEDGLVLFIQTSKPLSLLGNFVAGIITPAAVIGQCPTNLVNCPFDCAHERTKCPTRLVIVTVLRRCMKYSLQGQTHFCRNSVRNVCIARN